MTRRNGLIKPYMHNFDAIGKLNIIINLPIEYKQLKLVIRILYVFN